MLETMQKDKMKQAKALEQHLKLCNYAFALAVSPGINSLPRRERLAALEALEKNGKNIPIDLTIAHTQLFAIELMATLQAEEAQPRVMSQIVEALAVWKGLQSTNVTDLVDDWSCASPSFGSLVSMVMDSHKLLPEGPEKEEKVTADLKAGCVGSGEC